MKTVKGSIREALAQIATYNKQPIAEQDLEKELNQHTEGSFYGRDDLVKKWSTPKKDRHLYIKLAKDDASGHHRASMKRKGNEKKIADLKRQGYKEVPFESKEELQQCIDERETDKYGNPKLSDADKDKIGKLRQKIKDHEILANRLRDEISQIKKNAGIED